MSQVVSFDPINLRIVEIDSGLPVNELLVLEVYSEWKQWLLDDPTRLGWPQAFRTVGGDPISDQQSLGITYFLANGWRIRPAEYSHKFILTGNLFTDPAGSSIVVPTLGAFTINVEARVSNLTDAVLINSPDIQYSSFEGAVHVSVASGVAGTDFPTGTPRRKSNNLVDALAIAAARGFRKFHVHGDLSIAGSFDGMRFEGISPEHTTFTIGPGASVADCEFVNATVQGTVDGGSRIVDCVVADLDYVDGAIVRCALAGTISLSGASPAILVDCWDGFAGFDAPIIDCGSGTELNVRRYSGGLVLRNKTGPESVSIDGQVRLVVEASVVAGSIVLRGLGHVANAGSATLDEGDLMNLTTVASAVWDFACEGGLTAKQSMRLMNAVLGGKISGAGSGTNTFRDPADTRSRVIATVDSSGNRTAIVRDLDD